MSRPSGVPQGMAIATTDTSGLGIGDRSVAAVMTTGLVLMCFADEALVAIALRDAVRVDAGQL